MYRYRIDFGTADTGRAQKRAPVLGRDTRKTFEISLTKAFDRNTISSPVKDPISGSRAAEFHVNRIGCGIFGSLVFGHIESYVWYDVTQLDISLVPNAVHTALNLEFLFSGRYEKGVYGFPNVKKTSRCQHTPVVLMEDQRHCRSRSNR